MRAETRDARVGKRSTIAPPPFWMISEEAICARADELTRRDQSCSVEESRRQAEAEFRAAAGGRKARER